MARSSKRNSSGLHIWTHSVNVNDFVENMSGSEICLCTDDDKVFKHILNPSHTVTLQDDVNKLNNWSGRW